MVHPSIVHHYPPSYPIQTGHPHTSLQARAGLTIIAHNAIADLHSWPHFPGDRYITFPVNVVFRFIIRLSWDRIYFYVFDLCVGDVIKISTASMAAMMGRGVARRLADLRRTQFINGFLQDTVVKANVKALLESSMNNLGGQQGLLLRHLCPEGTTWKAIDVDDARQFGVQGSLHGEVIMTVKITRRELLDGEFDVVTKVTNEILVKQTIIRSLVQHGPNSDNNSQQMITQWKLEDLGDDIIQVTECTHGHRFGLERRMLLDPSFSPGRWVANEWSRSFCHSTCISRSQSHPFYRSEWLG